MAKLTYENVMEMKSAMEDMGLSLHVVTRYVHDNPMVTLIKQGEEGFFFNGKTGRVTIQGGPRDGEDLTEKWAKQLA